MSPQFLLMAVVSLPEQPKNLIWERHIKKKNSWQNLNWKLQQGAKQPRPVHGTGPFDTVPLSFVRKICFQTALDVWQDDWDNKQKARQTKIVCPKINLAKGKQVTNLDRKDVGLYVRWATGHSFLNYHKSLIDKGETNPMCRLCGEDLESSSHLLFECPTLITQRQYFFGRSEDLDPTKIPV